MARLIGEFNDFVFNGRAVARADTLDLSAVHRRAMHILADHVVSLRGGERDEAGHLPLRDGTRPKAEWRGIEIAGLHRQAIPIDGTSIQPWRRAGFEPAAAQAKSFQ